MALSGFQTDFSDKLLGGWEMDARGIRAQVLARIDARVATYAPIYSNCAQVSFLALKEQFSLGHGAIV